MSAERSLTREDRERLLALYKAHGGKFHGPHVEHASIEEEAFWRFVAAVHADGAHQVTHWAASDDDRPLPEDDAIEAAHPVNDKRNTPLFEEALRLVDARRSKYGLVELVTWLLARERDAKSERDAFAVQSHARGQASLSTGATLAERSTLASRLATGLEQSLALIGDAMQDGFDQQVDPEITPDGSVKGSDLEALLEEARAAGLLAPRPTG
jgi:hypothetical protein